MTKEERNRLLQEKLTAMKEFDNGFTVGGSLVAAGTDEAGRGPLAGPVVAACVVLPEDFDVIGVDDSKKLSEKKREELFDKIQAKALAIGVGISDNITIDQINILQATKKAMKEAFLEAETRLKEKTGQSIDVLLADAVTLEELDVHQEAIIKGDAKSLSIAAASIIAKVTRDRIMLEYHRQYPWYGFDRNKGYGTKAHYQGIGAYGITPIHRKTFLKNL
ncbi:MAG: ribonuclease HII [Candidatus Fimisoma sp.]|jgi:ribonuclease HII|nr:ribonuclease HII [Bacillota bacterium]MDY4748603.1 ribonuclease HII [Candidatus Fimisoma sp.]